jgi:hypothetical protein
MRGAGVFIACSKVLGAWDTRRPRKQPKVKLSFSAVSTFQTLLSSSASNDFCFTMFIINWFWDVLAQLGSCAILHIWSLLSCSRAYAQECQNSLPWSR